VTRALPDALRTRRNVGFALFVVGQLVGGARLLLQFLAGSTPDMCATMCLAAGLAFPAGAVYLTVPRLLDRYDPEPWYALLGCLSWGAIAACGFSAIINGIFGEVAEMVSEGNGDALMAVVSAPIFEEFFKGLGVFGVFYFLRHEFDGIVDGIIYGTFTALGFAMVENIIYYTEAAADGELGTTFLVRGILFPWGHPVYTSLTGIGFGLARESEKPWIRRLGPILGYLGAVMLHAIWNGSATIAQRGGEGGAGVFLCMLPLWFGLVVAFLILIIVLVRRRGRIIRAHLVDEVALQHMSQDEVDLVASAFGVFKARMRYGKVGSEFVRACARLALSKWHAGRAQRSRKHTYSMEFIVPLRARVAQLRQQARASGKIR
jgi:RsiW-degrading membrane proteinase PrsW (M82 family)